MGQTQTFRPRPAPSRSVRSPPRRHEVAINPTASTPVREILKRYEIVPHKRFGQNFLHDEAIAARIVKAASIHSGEHVLEIGPGLGALTRPLLDTGASVTAVEVDPRIVAYLKDSFGERENLNLIEKSILEVDLDTVLSEDSVVVANVPYAITGPLLRCLIDHSSKIARSVVLVQKEVGARLVARAGQRELGAPAVLLRLLYEVKRLFQIGRGAFIPRPDVVSTLVGLSKLPGAVLDPEVRHAVNAAYIHRRKMLRKTLGEVLGGEEPVIRALAALGRDAGARPEDLEPAEWPELLLLARSEPT